MKDRRSALLIVLAGAIGSASASAQIVTDPTRPAAGFALDAPDDAAGNQLQSVMISPTRRAAIINGVMVELGGKYGDTVLTKVAEDEVVLGSGSSRQVLKLHPGVDKKLQMVRVEPVAPAAESRSPKPKAKAKPKAKSKPKASTQGEAKPVADSSAGTR
jgi:hypothetical protein